MTLAIPCNLFLSCHFCLMGSHNVRNTMWHNLHLYALLIPTSPYLASITDNSCNLPHKPTDCNTGTGFMFRTVTFLKHFKFGRAAAKASPAPEDKEITMNYIYRGIYKWIVPSHIATRIHYHRHCHCHAHTHTHTLCACVCVHACVSVCACLPVCVHGTREQLRKRAKNFFALFLSCSLVP